jgi:hypothetical protein
MLTFSGKGYPIRLAAPASATTQSLQQPPASPAAAKPFSLKRIAESVLV